MKSQLKAFTLTIAAIWITAIIFVFLSSIEEGPISISRVSKNLQVALIPQGWAFFTKDCREPLMSLYAIDKHQHLNEIFTAKNRNNPIASFDRVDRIRMVEISALLKNINDQQWTPCPDNIEECLTRNSIKNAPVFNFENGVSHPSFCGEMLITMSETVPWAWALLTDRKHMPGKSIKVFFSCNKGTPNV